MSSEDFWPGDRALKRPPKYPEIQKRIHRRLKTLGFWKNGKPDAARFIADKTFDPRSFYPWMNGEREPTGNNLARLAEALDTTQAYLIFGEETATDAFGQKRG